MDHAGGRSRWSGGGRFRGAVVDGRVVEGVVGPAAPEDAGPAGAQATQRAVLALAAGAGVLVDLVGPVVFAGSDERPPVDHVAHAAVGRVAEADLAAAPGGAGDRGESGLGEQGGGGGESG